MDGGGCLTEPLTAGTAGGLQARAASESEQPPSSPGPRGRSVLSRLILPGSRPGGRRPFGLGRRRSVASPWARRLPALTGTWLALGFFGAVGTCGLVLNGQYASFRAAHGDPRDIAARAVGLGIEKITITGISTLTPAEVLAAGGISPQASLAFLSAAELRARLEAMPLVRSAEIRKVYPGELIISLVERQPFALWQKNGELFVVAADGAVIDRLRDARLAGLPLVVGDRANIRAAEYAALLEAAGPVRAKIRAGMLLSGRRWTLKMENGLDVRLPETDAASAVARLARLDREQGLLDKDVLAIDLRMPDRVVVRLSEEAAAARNESGRKRPQRGVKGVET